MAKEATWDEAIQRVLSEADGALHYGDIAEKIAALQLRKVGANPAASVAATFSRSIKDGESRYVRVGDGQYALVSKLTEASAQVAVADLPDDADSGALRAFGMFWQRSAVVWGAKPRLLGRQGLGASNVNFAEQVGVYLLHDRERVIYVGRANDTLFSRLKAHTIDRLSGRWDRFSWFGLRSVQSDATLAAPSTAWTHEIVIETLEALLIESLEPPLNRKRGDNFSGIEYLQIIDPEIESLRKKQVLSELMKNAGYEL